MFRFVYLCLLRLHPPYFKTRFAEEMLWIFDQAKGNRAAAKLVADGGVSLVRQWALRREFWKESIERRSSDELPIFCTVDAFRPRPRALLQGIVLSILIFWAACWAVKYSWNRTANMMSRGIGNENNAAHLALGGHTVASGYRGTRPNSREPAISAPSETTIAEGKSIPFLNPAFRQLGSDTAGIISGQPNHGQSRRTIPAKSSAISTSNGTSDLIQAANIPIRLPHPSGKYGVARIGFDWVDSTRPETYAKELPARRELMVYVWYPTGRVSRPSTLSDYLPYADAIAKAEEGKSISEVEELWGSSWFRIFSNQVVADTHEKTPVASGNERFPLLMFSPGYGVPSTIYTTLLQEVVSHGYIVASIEPPYDVAAVAFPDGRVLQFRQDNQQPGESSPPGETWSQFLDRIRRFDESHVNPRIADIEFVIEQFRALDGNSKELVPFAGRIDLHNMGVWGHSIGGTAAGKACQLDAQIRACLSEDGGGVPEGDFLSAQPFMHIGLYHEPATDEQLAVHKVTRKEWETYRQARLAALKQLSRSRLGRTYEVTIKIPGADHYSFTDWPLLDAKNKKDIDTALRVRQPIQAYTIAFFDAYLKHQSETLLDESGPPPHGVTLEKDGKIQNPKTSIAP